MRTFIIALLASTALVACGQNVSTPESTANAPHASPAKIQSTTAALNAWFETKYEEQVAFSPLTQTALGRKTNYDKIDDYSQAARDTQYAWLEASIAEMKATFPYNELTTEAKTSYDIMLYQYEQEKASRPFDNNSYVFEQMGAIQSSFAQILIAQHEVETPEHMRAYIARIAASGRAIEQLIERSKANAANGVHPPKFAFEAVITESQNLIAGRPFARAQTDNAVWADAKKKIRALETAEKITAEEADALRLEARQALLGPWKSAYENLIAWQEEDIVNAPAIATGVGSLLPNGKAFYAERLANQTTTNLTPEEVHQIGLAEVARIRKQMEAIKDSVAFEGDLKAFFDYLRDTKDDERLYFPDTDEGRQGYIDEATRVIDQMKAELPNYFGILPKADMVVKRVEAFREQDGAAQHYFPSTPDGTRPGTYYAHLSDMTAMPKRELEVIAYHEGLPGHHMQIAIAQELSGIPTFRTQLFFTAYVEGWALYSERLATEIPGTYPDPYSEFGRLGSEMWRAIRLVVDTGLHSKGWTEADALDYFLNNAAITQAQALSETRRYIVWPGQATSYKIGMLKILELRAEAEAALGDKFDIKAFHDTVLGGGALPLAVLERNVDRWVESVKAG